MSDQPTDPRWNLHEVIEELRGLIPVHSVFVENALQKLEVIAGDATCTLCGGPVEFIATEQVWRHQGAPMEKGFEAQGFCPKYGYPVSPANPMDERNAECQAFFELGRAALAKASGPASGPRKER